MAARKKTATQVPSGFRKIDTRPKQLELKAGDDVVGVLGAMVKSKDPEKPDYRTVKTDDGLFFVPSHADLRVLNDYPVGTRVWFQLTGGEGRKGSPYTYDVAVEGE